MIEKIETGPYGDQSIDNNNILIPRVNIPTREKKSYRDVAILIL